MKKKFSEFIKYIIKFLYEHLASCVQFRHVVFKAVVGKNEMVQSYNVQRHYVHHLGDNDVIPAYCFVTKATELYKKKDLEDALVKFGEDH